MIYFVAGLIALLLLLGIFWWRCNTSVRKYERGYEYALNALRATNGRAMNILEQQADNVFDADEFEDGMFQAMKDWQAYAQGMS